MSSDLVASPRETTIALRNANIPVKIYDQAVTAGDADAVNGLSTGHRSPGLVLLHDLCGPDEFANAACQRLAALGYCTILPNLLARTGPPEDTSEGGLLQFALNLPDTQVVADAVAAAQWLADCPQVDPQRIGIIGFGWGGAYALMAAASEPRLRAVIDVGGTLTYPVLTSRQSGSPINFIADIEGIVLAAYPDNDPSLPAIEVERLRQRLVEHDKKGDVKLYHGAGPRFWNDAVAPATQLLWRRIEQFLQHNLFEPGSGETALGDYFNEASQLRA